MRVAPVKHSSRMRGASVGADLLARAATEHLLASGT
jgi:hypothetical protein